jgi:hypothetical protein
MATAKCSHCGISLPLSHEGPCPECGTTGKTNVIAVRDTISVRDASDLMRERKEVIQKYPWLRKVLLIFDVACLIGGLWLAQLPGFFIGLLLLLLGEVFGPKLADKIIITRDHWHNP